ILVNAIQPGEGITAWQTELPDIVGKSEGKTIADVFLSLVPRNLFKAAADGDILPLIVFSLLFGGVLTAIGDKGKTVIGFFEGVNLAIMEIVHLIIYIAPIGVMSIIGAVVAKNSASFDQLVTGLGKYTLTVLLGLAIHGLIILPLILKFLGKREPLKFVLNMVKPLTTAFATASSSATLPLNLEAAIEKNKLDARVVQFVLPLGATVNMNGTALYQAVAALFIAQISGIELTIGQQIIVLFTATLAAVGAAGIPHAGTVMMVTILHAVNLPVTGIGLIFAVDWFLDRCRTTVNVFDDAVAAAVIAQTKEFREN
ncbi:MAG: dicarboxylate/amino acid:cation symporter, partial [Candidatus Zixiibacteriota bacterium]